MNRRNGPNPRFAFTHADAPDALRDIAGMNVGRIGRIISQAFRGRWLPPGVEWLPAGVIVVQSALRGPWPRLIVVAKTTEGRRIVALTPTTRPERPSYDGFEVLELASFPPELLNRVRLYTKPDGKPMLAAEPTSEEALLYGCSAAIRLIENKKVQTVTSPNRIAVRTNTVRRDVSSLW